MDGDEGAGGVGVAGGLAVLDGLAATDLEEATGAGDADVEEAEAFADDVDVGGVGGGEVGVELGVAGDEVV